MKNIMFKQSKQILSLLIAFSVLAVSLFTGIGVYADATTGTTDTWDGSYSQPTATDTDGTTILISTAEELAWVILQSGTAGAGVTYKVADGITAFYMNKNTADLTLEQVKNSLDGNNTNAWEYQGNTFQGTLDGNGVAIYGLYSEGANDTAGQYSGLIPQATGDVAVKNLAVKNSYIGGYKYSSAIIGYAGDGNLTSLTVEKCVITNNYIYQTRTASTTSGINYSVGVIGGHVEARTQIPCYVTVNNCAIYGNELYSALNGNISGTIAYFSTKSTNASNNCYQFTNLMISGAAPWSGNDNSHARREGNFVNVYIDTDKTDFTYDGANTGTEYGYGTLTAGSIELLDTANMQGAAAKTNMPNLAWGDLWETSESGFPIATFIKENADLIGDDSGDTGTTDTWDGSYSQPTATDTDGTTILISTAEELAWVILQSGAAGAGVTYKVADGITAFYMNENTADLTLEQVKNSLGGNNTNAWECQGNAFQGTLDGNGVAIYGLYSVGTTNDTKGAYGALVPTATGNVTVKNIAVKNSYIGGYLYASAIIGYAADGALTALTVEKCVITNNYIYQTRTASSSGGKNYSVGVLGGYISAATESASVTMDNCLIYGNELYSGMPGNISATIARFNTSSANAESGCYKFTNLIISGAAPWCGNFTYWGRYIDNFSNVYSDTDASKFTKTSNTFSDTYLNDETISAQLYCSTSNGKIEIIDNANMQGAAAQTNMPNLDWTNTWITIEDNYPALRVFYNATGDDSGDGSEGDEGDDNHTTPDGAWDGTAATSYADGDGTEANPFIIENVAQLYKMVKDGGEDASGNAAYFKVKDGVYDLYANPVEGMTSDEIKAYFADSTTYKAVWDPQTTEFNGTFDGNGVNIHGLYNVKAATSAGVAFLPRVSNSKAFINNVQFSDCYFENTGSFASGTSAAVLVGRSDNSDISFNNVAVCNSTAKCAAYVAAVFVAQNGATVTIDTAFTSGNTLYSEYYYSESLTYTYEGILYGNTSGYLYTIKNSVFTETDEYMSRVHYNVSIKFENSYVAALTASSITGISVSEISQSNMIGASAQTNMPDLDWTTWILTDSYPVIAALHDLTYTTTGDSGHTVTCGDCDISISLESHNYNSNYVCTLCAFEHSHTLVDSGIDYDATCVDDGVMNVKCEYCDYTSTREICAKNHIFGEVIAATAGDCQTEATVAYKTCSQCELCFTPEEDVTSINPLDHIGTGYTGRHDWVAQPTIESTCTGGKDVEYFKCSVCNTYLVEGVMTDVAPTEIGGHTASGNYYISENAHASICVVCDETFNEQAHIDADVNGICDICGWPCGEHIFEGASITLTDSIAVNYMIKKSVVETLGYDNLYIKFTFRGNDYTVSNYTEKGEYYVFTLDKIAPHRMTDAIYATLHGTKDGVSYTSETCEYSIKRYCYNMLEKSTDQDAKLRTLLVDLLNYGSESQIYTGYNTDKPANADLTDVQKTWGTPGNVTTKSVQNLKYKEITNPTVTWKAAGLYLDEEATLRFTIQTDSIENLVVKVTCGTTTLEIPASQFVKRNDVDADNMYYVYVRGINVTQMRDEVYLTVCSGDTAVSNTICYSVESYANAKIDGEDAKLSNLLIAMMKYGDAAKAYAENL